MLIVGIIVGLIVLVLLVSLHELGHALAAKRSGVGVEEFGIGFPPRAWAKKLKNGTLFSLNWLPLGGFVKLQGEHDSATKKGDYGAATFWQKTKILLAGVVVNWVTAVILLMALAWTTGIPKIIPNQFTVASDTQSVVGPVTLTNVVGDYPAARAGLQAGDQVNEFAGKPVKTAQDVIDISLQNRGKEVKVGFLRGDDAKTATVKLRDAESSVFGASLGQSENLKATWSAPVVGAVTTAQYTWVTFQGLGDLVVNFFGGLFGQLSTNEASRAEASERLSVAGQGVAGPIGILGSIFPAASQAGPSQVVFLAAIISLTLAVMNILPIPALDGGRWFVMALFRVIKKPLTKEQEENIHGAGFLFLMLLVIVITIADVTKLL